LEELLDEVLRRSGGDAPVPAVTPSELRDDAPLDQPVEEEFRVGTMALAWDPEDQRVVIEAQEVTETEQDAEIGEDDPAIGVLRGGGGDAPVPAGTPSELRDDAPLDQPVEEELRVGTMALAWDPEDQRVVIEAQEVTETEQDAEIGEDDPAIAVLRVRISPAQARAFAERALKVVAAGRPPCPLCGLPLDAEGHVCPRQHGYLG